MDWKPPPGPKHSCSTLRPVAPRGRLAPTDCTSFLEASCCWTSWPWVRRSKSAEGCPWSSELTPFSSSYRRPLTRSQSRIHHRRQVQSSQTHDGTIQHARWAQRNQRPAEEQGRRHTTKRRRGAYFAIVCRPKQENENDPNATVQLDYQQCRNKFGRVLVACAETIPMV